MKTDSNEPLHPILNESFNPSLGLTKREYFAAQCLCGLMTKDTPSINFPLLAETAVRYADALIIALNKIEP